MTALGSLQLEAQVELMTLQRDRQTAELALARVLGLSRAEEPWALHDAWPELGALPPDDDTLVSQAMAHRLDARPAEAAVRVAEAEVIRQYRSIFPNVTLGAEMERSNRRSLPGRKVLADAGRVLPAFDGPAWGFGASRADVVQSGLLSNPTLAISVRFPKGGGRSNIAAGLAQQPVDLWQIPVRKRITEAQLEATVLTVAHQAVTLAADV